jgi:hypothetical protein
MDAIMKEWGVQSNKEMWWLTSGQTSEYLLEELLPEGLQKYFVSNQGANSFHVYWIMLTPKRNVSN